MSHRGYWLTEQTFWVCHLCTFNVAIILFWGHPCILLYYCMPRYPLCRMLDGVKSAEILSFSVSNKSCVCKMQNRQADPSSQGCKTFHWYRLYQNLTCEFLRLFQNGGFRQCVFIALFTRGNVCLLHCLQEACLFMQYIDANNQQWYSNHVHKEQNQSMILY